MHIPSISIEVLQAARRSDSSLRSLDAATLDRSELRYRKFLALVAKYPNESLAPAKDIDDVWHLHMLHPRAYVDDCMRIFGSVLDHDGGFGNGSAEEFAELESVFARTSSLWAAEFDEIYAEQPAEGVVKCIRACRVACKKKVA